MSSTLLSVFDQLVQVTHRAIRTENMSLVHELSELSELYRFPLRAEHFLLSANKAEYMKCPTDYRCGINP